MVSVLTPDDPPPAVLPSPNVTRTADPGPSPTPSATPTPSPEPTVSVPPERVAEVDDATVLEHTVAPRTGEVWETPTRIEDPPDLIAKPFTEGFRTFLVGRRGAAEIYAVLAESGMPWDPSVSVFEVDATAARFVTCPSVRPDDPCAEPVAILADGVTTDTSTFYDTLTLPRTIALTDDCAASTVATTGSDFFTYRVYGDGGPLMDRAGTTRTLLTVRPVHVVDERTPSGIAGLTNLSYAIRTPFGSLIRLDSMDLPAGDLEAIRWDDGVTRRTTTAPSSELHLTTSAPGAPTCFSPTFSVEDEHAAGEWGTAGTTPDGCSVYVPVPGGNAVSRAVRAWQEASSVTYGDTVEPVTGAAAEYPFATDEKFLDANAVFAVQGPAGEWLLGMRADASNVVIECA